MLILLFCHVVKAQHKFKSIHFDHLKVKNMKIISILFLLCTLGCGIEIKHHQKPEPDFNRKDIPSDFNTKIDLSGLIDKTVEELQDNNDSDLKNDCEILNNRYNNLVKKYFQIDNAYYLFFHDDTSKCAFLHAEKDIKLKDMKNLDIAKNSIVFQQSTSIQYKNKELEVEELVYQIKTIKLNGKFYNKVWYLKDLNKSNIHISAYFLY